MEYSDEKIIIQTQAIIRGKLFRTKRLPNSLFTIQKILQQRNIELCETSNDGRVNSCMDEDEIIRIISEEIPTRILKPDKRTWYDILIHDNLYGWLPVNIKSTITLTSDNTGNLAMCVYAYTDEELDVRKKNYNNGKMSKILIEKLKQNQYNSRDKKDYYFVVVNKENNKDIIINSVKGLTELTPNIHNLPFQVCWNKNRQFNYKNINENIKLLLNALQKPKPSWTETFLSDVRKLVI